MRLKESIVLSKAEASHSGRVRSLGKRIYRKVSEVRILSPPLCSGENTMKEIIVKKSKINKKGVFAGRDFKKGEVVLKWHPKVLVQSEAQKIADSQKNYLYKAGRNKYFLMQPPERFVNHSCEANTKTENDCDIAIRKIKQGEEITSSYGKGGAVSFKCECGSKNCNGVVI